MTEQQQQHSSTENKPIRTYSILLIGFEVRYLYFFYGYYQYIINICYLFRVFSHLVHHDL
jgi:hypothetical protein